MIIFGGHKHVSEWASQIIFGCKDGWDEKARAISVVKDEKIIAAVIYTNWQPDVSMEMSIASVDKSWATRDNLRAFFKYPFIDLSVKRVQAQCSASAGGTMAFLKRLGFKPEGYHRCAGHDGGDIVSFGMLKNECKWIE